MTTIDDHLRDSFACQDRGEPTTPSFTSHTTSVRVGEGEYRAVLDDAWDNWGPIGGYVAAVLIRAAAHETQLSHVASVHCQFVKTATFGPIDLSVTTSRATRRSHALEVTAAQSGHVVARASIWFVADLSGPSGVWLPTPELDPPTEYPALDDLVRDAEGWVMPAWENAYEIRLATETDHTMQRPAAPPFIQSYVRFRDDEPCGVDPIIDACRAVLVADVVQFPAAVMGFDASDVTFIAPTMDLYVAFHSNAPASPWLTVEGIGTAAGAGMMAGRAHVWTADGELLATASQQMMIRKLG